jgi:hypothetical protein
MEMELAKRRSTVENREEEETRVVIASAAVASIQVPV